jgi:hypothetical protein
LTIQMRPAATPNSLSWTYIQAATHALQPVQPSPVYTIFAIPAPLSTVAMGACL